MKRSKIWKIVGGIITVIVIVFIIKKLLEFDIDYTMLLQPQNLVYLIIVSIVYGVHMLVLCIPWKTFIQLLSGKKIPFHEAAWVYNKSNLLKYIPGNVFQYIGRNELAFRMKVSHVDVSFSTVCDVLLLVVMNFVLSILFYGDGVSKWLAEYGTDSLYWIFIVIAVICAIAIVLFIKKREKVVGYFAKLKVFFRRESLAPIIGCIVFDAGLCILIAYCSSIAFNMMGIQLKADELPIVMGAYMLSWIAGFIIPGAPGGIGIREAARTLLLAGIFPVEQALLSSVIFRFIMVIGELIGLLLAFIVKKLSEKKIRNQENVSYE